MSLIKYRIRVFSFLGILWSVRMFSQEEIKLDVHPSKISTYVSIIVPHEQYVLLERYHNFKHNYWVGRIDTLKKVENGMLQGNGILINPETFTEKCNKCDTVINEIRNSSLNEKLLSELSDIARKDIGYDNKEFANGLDNGRPTEYDEKKICHEEFKATDLKWFNEQIERINDIKKKKIERLQWIKSNENKIDKKFIEMFLQDYGSCETDQVAIIELMKIRTDDFLNICNDLNDSDFYDVKLKLEPLPSYLKTNEVIQKIKASKIKSNRVRKLIRVLSRNEMSKMHKNE